MNRVYTVLWVTELDAQTPLEAAQAAWDSMRAPDSVATQFTVYPGNSDDPSKEDTFIVDLTLGRVERVKYGT